jgi:ATP-binding cassette subfamily A (ABC1) protein 3
MVSGASSAAYWSATYTWDLITYAATLAITMLIFELYQDKAFIGSWTKAGATLAVLMSFGASVIPLTYCYSFGFSNHANAQVLTQSLSNDLVNSCYLSLRHGFG